jgi:hypothetical protein
MPGYSSNFVAEKVGHHQRKLNFSSNLYQSGRMKFPIRNFNHVPEMSIHSFSRVEPMDDKLDELIKG